MWNTETIVRPGNCCHSILNVSSYKESCCDVGMIAYNIGTHWKKAQKERQNEHYPTFPTNSPCPQNRKA